MWESRQVPWSPSLGFFLLFPSPLPKPPTAKTSISSYPLAKHQRGPVISSCRWSWERATVVAGRPVYCHLVVVRESAAFSAGLQARSPEQLVLETWTLPEGFQRKVSKGWMREGSCAVCDQFIDVLLMGWQWRDRESTSSNFWFQPVWGLHACERCTDNFLQLVGVSISVKRFTAAVLGLFGTRD